jgi:hypothetical protein
MTTLPPPRSATELVIDHPAAALRLLYGRRILRLQRLRKLGAPASIIDREAAMVTEARAAWLLTRS